MGRSAAQHDARKARIIEAALDCFARYGYEGATNRLIADAAGMKSAALIYHYFPSKEDLFRACFQSISELDTLRATFEQGFGDPPEVYLRRAGLAYLAVIRQPRTGQLARMLVSQVQNHPELTPLILSRLLPNVIQPLHTYMSRQVETGAFRTVSVVSILEQFFAPLFFYAAIENFNPVRSLPFPMPSETEFVDTLVDTLLNGVRQVSPFTAS